MVRTASTASSTTASTATSPMSIGRPGSCSLRELDELVDQLGQPRALVLHPAGEPADGLGVVGRVGDGLGEQRQRADRRLELVADVRDEVAAHGVEPARLGDVLAGDEHELRGRAARPGRRRCARRRRRGRGRARSPGRGGRRAAARRGPRRRASSTTTASPRTRPSRCAIGLARTHAVVAVDDDGGAAQRVEDVGGAGAEAGGVRRRGAAVARPGVGGAARRATRRRPRADGDAEQHAQGAGQDRRDDRVHTGDRRWPDRCASCHEQPVRTRCVRLLFTPRLDVRSRRRAAAPDRAAARDASPSRTSDERDRHHARGVPRTARRHHRRTGRDEPAGRHGDGPGEHRPARRRPRPWPSR